MRAQNTGAVAEERSSLSKWPVTIKMEPVMESAVLDERFTLYFVTGTMTPDQHETTRERMPRAAVAKLPLDGGLCVFSALVAAPSSTRPRGIFTKLAKEWRGQYYSVTNRFVDEYARVVASR